MNNPKKTVYILLVVLLILLVGIYFIAKNPSIDNSVIQTESVTNSVTSETTTREVTTTTNTEITPAKIIPGDTLCAQITKEFVTQATGVAIARTEMINDFSITACNFYLSDDTKSPYIAVILNKNLSIEVQKTFYSKQKLDLITDAKIISNHIIYMDVKENRIAHIDLIIDPMNFIRIDKNVERAIDNEGLIKLAAEIAKRL